MPTDDLHLQFDIALIKTVKKLKDFDKALPILQLQWDVELYIGPVAPGSTMHGMLLKRLRARYRKVLMDLRRSVKLAAAVVAGNISVSSVSALVYDVSCGLIESGARKA